MSELSDKENARRRARLERAVTPQGSGGYARQREVYRKPITAPSWVYWPANRIVAQWQVVSLSLGLDPDSLEQRDDYITTESFPDADTQGEFRKRIDLLGALTEKVCAPLSQFVGILGMVSMPPELSALNLPTPGPATIETAAGDSPIVCAAISNAPQQLTDEPPMRVGSNSAASYKPWIAWQAKNLTKGDTDTVDNLATRIVEIAAERHYRNQSGDPFTAPAVARLMTDLVPGITGTRSKNGRKQSKSD